MLKLHLTTFESQNGPVNFNRDRLASLNYNPLFSSTNQHPLLLSSDSDPDCHFCNSYSNRCDYFIKDQFNEMLKSERYGPKKFSLLHLNIRSLERNLHNLTNLLSNLNIGFSAIGITETWLQNSAYLVDIDGYNFFHKHRTNRIGGGVGLYLSDCLVSKIRSDISFGDDEIAEANLINLLLSFLSHWLIFGHMITFRI